MKRRLAALATLAKIQERELDVRASELIELQSRKSELANKHEELERRRIEESAVTMPEAMPYLGGFLESIRAEERHIHEEEKLLDRKIEHQRDDVIEAWRDAKTTRHLEYGIVERLQSEADAREQVEMEERSIIAYARASSGKFDQS